MKLDPWASPSGFLGTSAVHLDGTDALMRGTWKQSDSGQIRQAALGEVSDSNCRSLPERTSWQLIGDFFEQRLVLGSPSTPARRASD